MNTWDQMTNEELCVEYQETNSDQLFEYFLARNSLLGYKFAGRYIQRFPEYEDDFDEAVRIAMWFAMKKFDLSKKVEFSTYYWYYVRSECQAVIRSRHSIRLPRHVWEKITKIDEEKSFNLYRIDSLDFNENTTDSGEVLTLKDIIPDRSPTPEDIVVLQETRAYLTDLIDKYLKPSEAVAIKMYFGLGAYEAHTLEQVGEQYHLTRERIRQLILKGIERLKVKCDKETFYD